MPITAADLLTPEQRQKLIDRGLTPSEIAVAEMTVITAKMDRDADASDEAVRRVCLSRGMTEAEYDAARKLLERRRTAMEA